jgi:hypothetical protein
MPSNENKITDRRWQCAFAEADDFAKPVTHKLKRIAPVRCSAWLGRIVITRFSKHDNERKLRVWHRYTLSRYVQKTTLTVCNANLRRCNDLMTSQIPPVRRAMRNI